MRTTLILEDQIFRRAKLEASNRGTTLSDLVNMALREHLFSKTAKDTPKEVFFMPVFGESGALYQTPQELAKLRDEGR